MGRASDEYGAMTPAGAVRLIFEKGILVRVVFDDDAPGLAPPPPFGEWFEAYMDRVFLPPPPGIVPPRTNPEQAVRQALLEVPPGTTITYGELARLVGSSPRGVASVLRANPVPIIVPCHRVVSGSGPGGYSQGLDRKIALLRWEGAPPLP